MLSIIIPIIIIIIISNGLTLLLHYQSDLFSQDRHVSAEVA